MKQELKVAYTDGGRHEAGIDETNDCVVRALALFNGISYADAHALLKQAGRKDRRGAYFHQYGDLFYGNWNRPAPQVSTVGRLTKKFPKGKIAVQVRGHIFVLEDGVQRDTFLNRKAVRVVRYCVAPEAAPAVTTRRSAVRVNGQLYQSVYVAFVQLGLDVTKHQRFRKQLKLSGSATFNGFKFTTEI